MHEPTAFGDYLLLELMESDRLSQLFIAKAFGEAGAGMLMSVKRFEPFFSQGEPEAIGFLEQLRHEASLDHPNICRVSDTGFHDGQIFVAMEHVVGVDLAEIVEALSMGRRLPWPIAVIIVVAVLRALHAAHMHPAETDSGRGVVHKFISPSRVLVGSDGAVKVRDFSLSQTLRWVLT